MNFHVQFIHLHAKIAAVEIYGVLILGTHLSESMLLALCLYSPGAGTYDLIVCS